MMKASHKLPRVKPADPHYCEALGRACRSKACEFGCKMLRARRWQAAAPQTAQIVAAQDDPVALMPAAETVPAPHKKPKKPLVEPIDLSNRLSGDHLSVLEAALAGLEQVDLVMSMAARMLGIAQAGTALDGMRETKRSLAALIAEVGSAKSRNDAEQ
jgi:hypothetical protein